MIFNVATQEQVNELNNKLTTITITPDITLTKGEIENIWAYRTGNVVMITINCANANQIASGGEIIEGQFNDYIPLTHARGSGVFGDGTVEMWLNNNGKFGIRIHNYTLKPGEVATSSVTYIVAD